MKLFTAFLFYIHLIQATNADKKQARGDVEVAQGGDYEFSEETSFGGEEVNPSCEKLVLEIVPDNYPSEISWEVEDPSGNTVVSESDITCSTGKTCTYMYCIPPECGNTFIISDSSGDGICCSTVDDPSGEGSYSLIYAGVEVARGGDYGYSEETSFGCEEVNPSCEELVIEIVPDNYPSDISWEVEDPSGNTVVSESHITCSPGETCTYEYCVPPECENTFTIYDSYVDGICCIFGNGSYSVTYAGVEVARGGDYGYSEETSFGCEEVNPSCKELVIEIVPDNYPSEISWEVEDPSGNTVVSESDITCPTGETCTYKYCVPPKCEYTFTISDSYGDGICCSEGNGSYSVTYAYAEVAQGGDYGSSEETSFVIC